MAAITWTKAGEWITQWSAMHLYRGTFTSESDGTASGELKANGFAVKAAVVLGTATGLSLTLLDDWDGGDILDGTGGSLAASKALFPQLNGSAGYVPVVGAVNAVVTGAGDGKTATIYLWVKL